VLNKVRDVKAFGGVTLQKLAARGYVEKQVAHFDFGAAGPGNVGNNGAIAIGGYIALSGLWAGSLTGASMNAVRTLAPDLVRGDLSTTWIYVIATFTGAIIAVGFEWILKGKPSKHADEEAQGSLIKDAKRNAG